MKTRSIFLLSFFCMVLFVTCKKENMCDCFKRTGDVIMETRTVDPFTRIYVQDRINVILTEDTSLGQEVIVEAGEKLIGLIRTEVVDGELRIHNDNKCDFTRRYDIPVNVYIRVSNNIDKIFNRGTGLVSNTNACTAPFIDLWTESAGDIVLNVDAGDVFTHQHSAGDVEIIGSAERVVIYNTGGGFTITDECTASYGWVYSRTTGKITIHAVDELDCEIDGSGNTYYRGQPPIIHSVEESSGRLLPLQ